MSGPGIPEPSPLRRARDLVLAALAGAALTGLGALVPPAHLLTHEYTQIFTVVGAGVLLLYARFHALLADRGRGAGTGDACLAHAWATGLAFGAGGFVFHLLVDPARGCRVATGATFFWITWVPAAALAAAAGTGLGLRGWRVWKVVLSAACVWAAGIGHAQLQALVGLRMIEPLLGAPLLVDQRASLVPDGLQYLQRAWLFVAAAALWSGLRRGAGQPGWAPGAALLGMTLLVPSWFGLGFGRGAQESVLDGQRRTAHFDLRYPTGGTAELYVEVVAREAEWQRHLLSRDWAFPEGRIRLLLTENGEQLQALSGVAAPHAWYGGFGLPWDRAQTSTLRHELVHVVHALTLPNPITFVDRATVEGTAEAWERDFASVPTEHAKAAAALARGDLPSAGTLLHPTSFWTLDESAAYEVSGSLMAFLAQSQGSEAFRRYLAHGRLAAIGLDADALDAAWRQFLATIPVSADADGAAKRMFDPLHNPPYTAQQCPKVGPLEPAPLDLAARRWGAPDFRGAAAAYAQVFEETGDAVAGAWSARASARAGDAEQTLVTVAAVRARGELDGKTAEILADSELGALLLLGRGEDARARASTWPPSATRALVVRLLADPTLAGPLATLVLDPSGASSDKAIAELRARVPDDPDLVLLEVLWGPPLAGWVGPLGITHPQRVATASTLGTVRARPDLCSELVDALASGGRRAVQLGESALAEAYADTLDTCAAARPTESPRAAFDAARIRARLRWEQEAWPGVRE